MTHSPWHQINETVKIKRERRKKRVFNEEKIY